MELNNNQSFLPSIESGRILCETVAAFDIHPDEPLSLNPKRLIGYPHFAAIFRSLVPNADYDDDGRLQYLDDFPELYPDAFPSRQATGNAVLFAGAPGCGKHTADYTFMSLAYQYILEVYEDELLADGDYTDLEPSDIDEVVRFYQFDIAAYGSFSDRALGEELDRFMEQITQTVLSDPVMIYYISLGDVTRILNSQRLAPAFVSKIRRLIDDPGARCILTCIYNGKASQIKDAYKLPFCVLEMTPPKRADREEYYRYLLNRYPNINFGMDVQGLTELTEGFTFSEIKRLTGYLIMAVKAQLKKHHLTVKDIRVNRLGEKDLITLSESTVGQYAAMIRDVRYVPAAPAPGFTVISGGSGGGDLPGRPVSVSESNEKTIEKKPDQAEAKKESVDEIDTIRALRRQIDQGMMIPAGYHLKVLMKHRTFDAAIFNTYAVSVDAFLRWCSASGVTNLSNIKSIQISLGGNLVLHPVNKELLRPLKDGSVYDYHEIIREGAVLSENLSRIGKDSLWLQAQLMKNRCSSEKEVFLGVCDENNELIVFKKR